MLLVEQERPFVIALIRDPSARVREDAGLKRDARVTYFLFNLHCPNQGFAYDEQMTIGLCFNMTASGNAAAQEAILACQCGKLERVGSGNHVPQTRRRYNNGIR